MNRTEINRAIDEELEIAKAMYNSEHADVEDQLEHLAEQEQERFDRDCDAHIMRGDGY